MSAASTASPSPTTFEMPETINGEEPPATVPFVKPEEAKATKSNEPIEIKHQRFASLDEAIAAYAQFCWEFNWNTPRPSAMWFVWASEQNWGSDGLRLEESDSAYVTFEAWRDIEDPRWAMKLGELVPREQPTVAELATENGQDYQEATAKAVEDDKFWRELEIMGQLRQAEIERQEAQTEFDIKTEERKEAKEHLASCTARVARITAQLVSLNTLPEPKKDQPGASEAKAPELAAQSTGAQAKTPEQTTGAPDAPADDSWRKEPTANIIKGLPGLGAKKLESICEKAPTVGDLEDLREKASLHHSPFKEMLPKGCGESIAQAVEDALLDFMFKWKDRPGVASTEAAAPSAPSEEQEPQTKPDDLADL